MMYDTTYRIGEPGVQVTPDENGNLYELQVAVPILAALPVGPGQMALMQMGLIRLPMDKTMTMNLIEALTEGSEMLSNRPQIQTASSMSEADAIAEMKRMVENPGGPR